MGEDHNKFVDMFAMNELVPPEVIGHVLASLATFADHSLTGQFLSWNDEILKPYRQPI